MPHDWHIECLGDLCQFRGGSAFPKNQQGSTAGEIPFIKVSDMELPANQFRIVTANNWIDAGALRRINARTHPADATVFAKIGIALRSNRRRLLVRPTAIDNNMMSAAVRVPKVTPDFLFYLLRCIDFNEYAEGSALPYLRVSDLEQIQVEIPPIGEQETIAGVLRSFDDKIDLNRRMNRTLQAMARAFFDAWFVEFKPIEAKAAGAIGFRGMPQGVFEQLPDQFIGSELGPIPAGWECVPIGDLVDVVGGATPSTKNPEFWEGGKHAFCTPKDMSDLTSPVLLDTERHITQAGVNKISSGRLPVGTVLLSSRAPIGYLAIAETPVSVNQGIIAMISGEIPSSYVLLWTEENMEAIKARAGGSTFAEISKRAFRPIPALRPDERTLAAFGEIVQPLFSLIAAKEREIGVLAGIRDALLPKLLSGEVRVCR